eukprot:5182451-Karenia_brevis.AAC.1
MLERRGSTAHSVDHRFQKAETAYGQIATMLRNRNIPVEERLKAWARGPMGSALYGCGGWYLNRDRLLQIRRWEYGHIKRFLRMRRLEDENEMMYHKRTNLFINNLFEKSRVLPGHVRVLMCQHKWIWTWYNFVQDDGSAPLRDYMLMRPAGEWQLYREAMAIVDYQNETGWRHQHSG